MLKFASSFLEVSTTDSLATNVLREKNIVKKIGMPTNLLFKLVKDKRY